MCMSNKVRLLCRLARNYIVIGCRLLSVNCIVGSHLYYQLLHWKHTKELYSEFIAVNLIHLYAVN